MVLTLLSSRRASYTGFEHLRDTGELLKASGYRYTQHLPHAFDAHNGAIEVTHAFHPDQLGSLDPVHRNHLRVSPAGRGFEPPK